MVDTAATANLLSDPTRVRILEALSAGPMRTAQLSAATGMTPAALSRHLNLLRKAEVVARKDVADDGRGHHRHHRHRQGGHRGRRSRAFDLHHRGDRGNRPLATRAPAVDPSRPDS